ncbi:hypothetical protein ACFCXA_16520 [Streptomyces virginiae]|uniref:hypothetical protein n=1 Tax=Streptomyces virginiae TaxID=1961 RepID=UPI00325114D7
MSVSDLGQPPLLTFGSATGAVAQRSPASAIAQDITGIYSLQRFSGGQWVPVWSKEYQGSFAPGQATVQFPAVSVAPTAGRGVYRFQFGFTWFASGTTTPLGSQLVISDSATDHQCVTPLRPCQAGSGSVQVGRLYSLGGGW